MAPQNSNREPCPTFFSIGNFQRFQPRILQVDQCFFDKRCGIPRGSLVGMDTCCKAFTLRKYVFYSKYSGNNPSDIYTIIRAELRDDFNGDLISTIDDVPRSIVTHVHESAVSFQMVFLNDVFQYSYMTIDAFIIGVSTITNN